MLTAIVLITIAVAPIGLIARRLPRPPVGWLLALIPLSIFTLLWTQAPTVFADGRIEQIIPWVPSMGLQVHFVLDGLSLLFTLIISGIGILVIGYAGHYMQNDAGMGRFLVYLIMFMGAMLGLVLAGNVLTMFVFWELTSITSYLLIGYKHEYADARRGAQQSLLVTAGGGLALLVGMLVLGAAAKQVGVPAAEAYTFQGIIGAGAAIAETALYTPAMILVFLGAFTKSAQFPFHFWLPGAMQAPTPASAFLHSATMVKAGIYLLARLAPGLGDTPFWGTTLVLVGGFTFAFGAVVAFRQFDIKALLAYTTLSMLGGLVMLIGLGGKYGAEALTANLLAHALYKSALFMIAGIIDHESGTRDIKRLGGLRRYMPRTTVVIALALLSQMGIPIFFGFVAKEIMLEAALESTVPAPLPTLALVAIVVGAVGYIIAAWRLFKNVFLGKPSADVLQHHIEDPPLGMLAAPAVPALLSILIPVALLPAVSVLLTPAAAAVYGHSLEFELALWHGVSTALIISLSIIIGGAVLASFERQLYNAPSFWPVLWRGDILFDRLINAMLAGVTAFTRLVQDGRLRHYIMWSLLTLMAATVPPLLLYSLPDLTTPQVNGLALYELVTALLIPVGVVATVSARSRLGAIISAGIVGAMISFIFVIYSAPDLALTQLLIEVISTVFFLLVFALLPPAFERLSSARVHLRDGIVAVLIGITMATFTYIAATSTQFAPISSVFKAESYTAGRGENVVNVIIVDFRGFDTMGEITVLFIALLGIYAMLRLRPTTQTRMIDQPAQPEDIDADLITTVDPKPQDVVAKEY
ncbi:MAG: DUF4040 domain-containing protein [Oscillochloris sp.]|nr:DUF4040 domain-containing protein [Oscillochloris sp.]